MADTPIDALSDWQGNEVISAVKLNAMNSGIRYSGKLSQDATNAANQANANAQQAQQMATQASSKADNAANTANTANTTAGNASTTANQAMQQAKDAANKIDQAIKGTGFATTDDLNSKFSQADTQINRLNQNLSNRWQSINNFSQISADDLNSPITYYISSGNNSTPNGHWGHGIIYPYQLNSWAYVRISFFDGNTNKVYTTITGKDNTEYTATSWEEVTGMDSSVLQNIKDMAQTLKTVNSADLNSLTKAMFYDVENINGNGPTGVRYATVVAIPSNDGNSCTQLLMDQMTGNTYVRSMWQSRWTSWSQLVDNNYLKNNNLDDSVKIHSLDTNTDLNNINVAGEYIGSCNGISNLPSDPDTNNPIANTTITVNVITDSNHQNGSQEVVQNAKGYKYLRGLNNGTWSSWSVLTPFS